MTTRWKCGIVGRGMSRIRCEAHVRPMSEILNAHEEDSKRGMKGCHGEDFTGSDMGSPLVSK